MPAKKTIRNNYTSSLTKLIIDKVYNTRETLSAKPGLHEKQDDWIQKKTKKKQMKMNNKF